jgi:very-short-patch-repair endonuclease
MKLEDRSSSLLYSRAKLLRKSMPKAEAVLWTHLSGRKLCDLKFTRQMPIGNYIADFACRSLMVIVEVDGISHDNREDYDAIRSEVLKKHGYSVIRFSNEDVLKNIYGVLESIAHFVRDVQPTPNPSLKGGDKP